MERQKFIDTIKSLLTLVEETYDELKPTTWQLDTQDEYTQAKELLKNLK